MKRNSCRIAEMMKLVFLLTVLASSTAVAQFGMDEKKWIDQMNLKGGLPEKLLSTRTVVFYDFRLTVKELDEIQQNFQRTGIDAEAYFEMDLVMAGKDITRAFGDYLNKREMVNMAFIEKDDDGYRITLTLFNGKETVIDLQQSAWSTSKPVLVDALKDLYRTASSQQRKQNLLINDAAEMDMSVNPILGKRNEFFAMDLKVDPLAVPLTGNEQTDKELEEIIKQYYPMKYKLTEPGMTEKEMRKQGLLYVLCVAYTRGGAAKELLGYDMSKAESGIVSVTYPADQQQLKTIGTNMPVYKFYFKHIDSQNVFLGTKWDADDTWQQALLNQLKGMKVELRLN